MSLIARGISIAALLLAGGTVQVSSAESALAADSVTASVSTNASRYAPGASVNVSAKLTNTSASGLTGTVRLHASHLGTGVGTDQSQALTLAAGASTTVNFTWNPPNTDFRGYLLRVDVLKSPNTVVGTGFTAVDVSSTATKFPRYGVASSFDSGVNAGQVASYLNKHHINAVQFYDWHWKHHVPLAGTPANPAPSWQDIANRTNQRQTVLDLINQVHSRGADAYNYNLIYGADSGYGEDGSGVSGDWAQYDNANCTGQKNHPLPAGWTASAIYLMNPHDTRWQNYLAGRESDVYSAYPFDGWQADQLGDQGFVYNCSGQQVDVAQGFNPLLNAVHNRVPSKKIVFNAVGQYGQSLVASNPNLPFTYTEAWPGSGQTTYADLKKVVDDNNNWSNGKAAVIAAYMNQNYGNNFSDSSPGQFNPHGVLMTDAVIFASGGSHIELGDVDHMLTQPYFPNRHLAMSDSLKKSVEDYYNFLVAYQNLLRDGATNSNNTISMPGTPTSTNGTGNTVWTFAKTKPGTDVLNFLNLTGTADTSWMDTNATRPAPTVQTNKTVKYYYQGTDGVQAVHFASPDIDGGNSKLLSFTTGTDTGGKYVQFTLPSLKYWDLVWLERGAQQESGTGPITGLAGKCMDVSGGNSANGTPIQLWSCANVPAQQWTVGGHQLKALGKCLDLEFQGTTNGTKAHLWDCLDIPSQKWIHHSNGELFNPASGRCLDVRENSSTDGTPLHLWDCLDVPSQKWTLPSS